MTSLDTTSPHPTDIRTIAAWIDRLVAASWEDCWTAQLPAVTALHERAGDAGYGLYNRALFAPVQAGLADLGVICRPGLPGTLPLSEEEWGPEDHRERRMWTLAHDADGEAVGAVLTRFFHDHTRLRLPARPTVVGLDETDHDRIRETVLGHPADWNPMVAS